MKYIVESAWEPARFESGGIPLATFRDAKITEINDKPCCHAVRIINKTSGASIWRCPVCNTEI